MTFTTFRYCWYFLPIVSGEYSVNLLLYFVTHTRANHLRSIKYCASGDANGVWGKIRPNKMWTDHDFSKSKTHKMYQQLFIKWVDWSVYAHWVRNRSCDIVTLRWTLWLLCCAITSNSSQCLVSLRKLLFLSNSNTQ